MKKTTSVFVTGFIVMFLSPLLVSSQVLDVPETIQEQNQWCWAAVSKCVLAYYGHDDEQCEIAEYTRTVATWHDFGQVNCCVNPGQGCNYWNYNWGYPGSIADILNHFSGITTNNTGSSLSKTQIETELNNGKPFIFRWGYHGGGGHFLVGHGLTGNALHYMDPWFGTGLMIADYGWVLSSASHSWTHTQRMTLPLYIVATANGNGQIFPSGAFGVTLGGRKSYIITPDDNYTVDYIQVDDVVIDLENDPGWDAEAMTYTFFDIAQNHTIKAWFKDFNTRVSDPGHSIVSVYPNPATHSVRLASGDKSKGISALVVYDISGKVIKAQATQSPGQYEYNLNVSDLETGVYLLKIQLGNSGDYFQKLVKAP